MLPVIQVELFQTDKNADDEEDAWLTCGDDESENSLFDYQTIEDQTNPGQDKRMKKRRQDAIAQN